MSVTLCVSCVYYTGAKMNSYYLGEVAVLNILGLEIEMAAKFVRVQSLERRKLLVVMNNTANS